MRRAFCFLCGKRTEKLKEGYCDSCYSKEHKSLIVPDKIEVTVCSKCNKVKIGNKWSENEIKEAVKRKIKSVPKNALIETKQLSKKKLELVIKTSEEYKTRVHLNRIMCPICSKISSGYYESIIQLRGDDIDRFYKIVSREIKKSKNPKAFFNVKDTKNGLDFYIGGKSVANSVADYLKRRYKLKIKKSYKLVTRKDGRDVYRTIISVRI